MGFRASNSPLLLVSPSPLLKTMVDRRELITICRQIGTMMEVGVDFLRLTRSLREQTENPRLLELYDGIERDMRMGENMADAIAKAPDIFSPFAVSLIRQGEARGDIEGAWHRLADFLKQEAQQDKDLGLESEVAAPAYRPPGAPTPNSSVRTVLAPPDWNRELRRFFALASAGLATSALIWAGAEAQLIAARFLVPLQLLVAAGFLFLASLGEIGANRKTKLAATCAFCGKPEAQSGVLAQSSLVAGAAICASCAAAFGGQTSGVSPGGQESGEETLSEAAKKQSAAQLDLARDFAEGFPARFSDRASQNTLSGIAPEFEIDGDEGENTPHQEKRFEL